MEVIFDESTPLAEYLEGDGTFEPEPPVVPTYENEILDVHENNQGFAPVNGSIAQKKSRPRLSLSPAHPVQRKGTVGQIHDVCSTAVNSRLGRADNARFLEHFRYVIVASQLLNEYLDHGSFQPNADTASLPERKADGLGLPLTPTTLYGAAATAASAFALVYILHWALVRRGGGISTSRVLLVTAVFVTTAIVVYAYLRRQWLKFVRRNAVTAASSLTANWQAFEVSASTALSLIQEVELVSKGYRLGTPLPPASRLDDSSTARRCSRLRKALLKSYRTLLGACTEACGTLATLIDEDDLERYYEIYDINAQDAKESFMGEEGVDTEDELESLKALRVLGYRASVLRRVTLCSLMALEADGGKPDFHHWRMCIEVMQGMSSLLGGSTDKLKHVLGDMEIINMPITPIKSTNPAAREKMRTQVRKISMLSSGIRGLQAKMQILREETNKSIEQSEDLTDLGPSLMAQYDSIGVDLRDLMQAWETGKASLQTNITKQERRISMNSSAGSCIRSPVSSLGGLTAVEESGSPADALKALTGDTLSNRSSMATTPSDEEQVFEAVAMPRQRSSLTREERIVRMQEERDRQATLRAKRESNTNMLRELETVMNLRPRPRSRTGTAARITSI
ncbi:hypothetical protein LTR78_004323 [Recurvomyces mirabilis]|uniref:Vezatin n=1 Tax=Recurvomyces mirabilis TaxID=574656 RepID=A0AAE0WPZ5_9PEZI|nr:hypothetical protein LTR78_004323 [Recurvomyces mirabilis]KAK5156010.1 hypothetical protein LTS14_005576 [Recurvomyces mirabilis]